MEEIVRDAALKGRSRANALLQDFRQAFEQIGTYPASGERWRGSTQGLRFKRVKPGWWVFYRDVPPGQMVDIVRIKWANADLEAAFDDLR